MFYNVQPSYGRDYSNVSQIKSDLMNNKDFQLTGIMDGGRQINLEQLKVGDTLVCRYKAMRSVTSIKITKLLKHAASMAAMGMNNKDFQLTEAQRKEVR